MRSTDPRRRRWRVLIGIGLLGLVASACAAGGLSSLDPAGPGSSGASAAPDGDARAYCTDQGGMLVDRVAMWDTNGDPSTWVPLAGAQTFCEFESGSGDETTRISVDLVTLSSPEPTLASIAYLSDVTITAPPVVGQNPGEWSCANDFDGASYFGNTAAGGGWVDTSQPVFVVMNQCVFADGSSIDAFGLWYHAGGAIRGADLAPLFAYQPGRALPAVFDDGG